MASKNSSALPVVDGTALNSIQPGVTKGFYTFLTGLLKAVSNGVAILETSGIMSRSAAGAATGTILDLTQVVSRNASTGLIDDALLPKVSAADFFLQLSKALPGYDATADQVLLHPANGAIAWANGTLGGGAAVMSVSIFGFLSSDSSYANSNLSPYTVANSVQDCHLRAYPKNVPAGAQLSYDWTYGAKAQNQGFMDQYGDRAQGVGIDKVTPASLQIGTTTLHLVLTATVSGQPPVTDTADFSIIRNG